MKWKDILLGAVATLVVTVLSGIAVYYFTKEPDEKKTERLIYSVQQSASFTGGNQDLAFTTVKVGNYGGVAAKRVMFAITFKAAQIKDFALDTKAGPREVAREIKPKSIVLTYETLLPAESITLNLMLTSAEKPVVSVRSEASLGSEKSLETFSVSPKAKVREFLELSVPITGVVLVLLTAFLAIFLRRSGFLETMSSDKNNAGFLLLHHGFVDEAADVLNSALHSGRYDTFTLSNLALCKALKGEHDQAKQLLRAANFRERYGHTKAVILFNEALISLVAGDKNDAIMKLKEAVIKSPAQIRRYCQHSVHLDAVRNEPAFYEIIKDE
jgi:hypothetical protein